MQWEDGKVRVKARWPKPDWEMYLRKDGPEKVEVWFLKKGRRPQLVEAWANGETKASEITCRGKWGTDDFRCEEREID